MYYSGRNNVDDNNIGSIGHAISTDGIVWLKDNEILIPTSNFDDWNGANVAEPTAIIYNDMIYLYFSALGWRESNRKPENKRVIGMSNSTNAYVFDSIQVVLKQTTNYSNTNDFEGYSNPSALVTNDQVHLFYDVYKYIKKDNPSSVHIALQHAFSSDGVNWDESDEAMHKISSFKWTKREIRSPSVLHYGTQFQLWFAGDNYIKKNSWGIGYSTAEDDIY